MNPATTAAVCDEEPWTVKTWDAASWNSVLDTTCGEEIVQLLAPLFASGYTLARVQGDANETKERVKAALSRFQLFPSRIHLLSVSSLQASCRNLERRLPEPVYRVVPDLLTKALEWEVNPSLEVALRAHPDVVNARAKLGRDPLDRLEQSLRAAIRAQETEGAPDPFFKHPVTDPLGDRAARNVLCILSLAITALLLLARTGGPHPLEAAVQPLLSLVQRGCFPLGATFEGDLRGGYVVLVA